MGIFNLGGVKWIPRRVRYRYVKGVEEKEEGEEPLEPLLLLHRRMPRSVNRSVMLNSLE